MSEKSQDKVRRVRNQVIEAVNKLSTKGPELRYLLLEEFDLKLLPEAVENTIRVSNPKTIIESLVDIKEGLQDAINQAEALSLEEKETLMEELAKIRNRNS